ncbi:MAG TPA: FixH family protein [Gaiellaceae bacterium]|nr:FixH family protein [Gaiellaceae bacterium]
MHALAAVAAALTMTAGPGPVHATGLARGYTVGIAITPNRALGTGAFTLTLARNGRPVAGARVRATVTMLDMNMGSFTLLVPSRAAGTYATAAPAVGMSGRWGWSIQVEPPNAPAFRVVLVDRMRG